MAVRNYWVIVEGDDKSGYSAFFPDLPGCVSAGETVEDCISNATDAASFHLEGMAEDGAPAPPASALSKLDIGKGVKAAAKSLVSVPLPGKAVRVNVTLDEGLLQLIDRAAAQVESNRSAFLADAARRFIRDASKTTPGRPHKGRARRAG